MSNEEIAEILLRIERKIDALAPQKRQDYVTKKEAKEMLQISDTTLQNLVKRGTIQVNGSPKQGKRLHYCTKSIQRYLANRT